MSALPTVLVFGRTGQVGREVCALLETGGYSFTCLGSDQCDLSKSGNISSIIRDLKPQVIVNAAAYTAVDKAESEPGLAEALNAAAPTEMAFEAKLSGALFLHYSTDYVFDGNSHRPWTEEDVPNPLNVYGRTKLNGERGVLASGAVAYTFRTSWVYGTHGSNFLLTMLKLAREREQLSVIGDQIGTPTWSRNLAELTLQVIRRFTNSDGAIDLESARAGSGIFHATSCGETSWHGFAEAIFANAREHDIELKVTCVREIKTAEWPSPTTRPKYSVLSNEKLHRTLEFKFPEWQEGLRAAMQELPPQRRVQ